MDCRWKDRDAAAWHVHSAWSAVCCDIRCVSPTGRTETEKRKPVHPTHHTLNMSAQLIGVPASTAAISAPEAGSVKLFGKWDASEVEIKDISLTGE